MALASGMDLSFWLQVYGLALGVWFVRSGKHCECRNGG